MNLRLSRFHRVGAAVHAVALSGDGQHLLVGSEHGLHLIDRHGNVKYRLGRHDPLMGEGAFSAVALSSKLEAGLAMERGGRLLRLRFGPVAGESPLTTGRGEEMAVAAVGIWEQRDDLYSLDYAPHAGKRGLIALGHHSLGLTALDGRGQLLWRLGPQDGLAGKEPAQGRGRRTWHAAISADGRTIYAAALGGIEPGQRAGIVAIDAALGKAMKAVEVSGRVTLLAGLPEPLGVVAAVQGGERGGPGCHLLGFDAELHKVTWSLACPPEVVITAVTAARAEAALFVGTNTGELWRVGAFTGRVLACYDLLFNSTVLSVAVAESGDIAAGLANGQVAFLERVRP